MPGVAVFLDIVVELVDLHAAPPPHILAVELDVVGEDRADIVPLLGRVPPLAVAGEVDECAVGLLDPLVVPQVVNDLLLDGGARRLGADHGLDVETIPVAEHVGERDGVGLGGLERPEAPLLHGVAARVVDPDDDRPFAPVAGRGSLLDRFVPGAGRQDGEKGGQAQGCGGNAADRRDHSFHSVVESACPIGSMCSK